MQTTISNEFLTVTIDTHGAEVVSVKNTILSPKNTSYGTAYKIQLLGDLTFPVPPILLKNYK